MEEAATIEELMFAMIERADRAALLQADANAVAAKPRTATPHDRDEQQP